MKNTRRCKICKERFEPWNNTLHPVCKKAECITEWHLQNREKNLKREQREWKKEKKEKLKTHGDYEKDLEAVIREICRLIDKDCHCISCGKKPLKANAGHRFAKGGNNTLRFNLMNVHVQCNRCNENLSGNPDGYDEGLQKVYGWQYYNFIKHEMKGMYPYIKLTVAELIEKRAIAMRISKALKKEGALYSPQNRITLRQRFNEEIGIYPYSYLNN